MSDDTDNEKASKPPNSMTLALMGAIAMSMRAPGAWTGFCCDQFAPSHTHVSLRERLIGSAPPNITSFPLRGAMTTSPLALGASAGAFWVQLAPFHAQVSFETPPSVAPPNCTTTPLPLQVPPVHVSLPVHATQAPPPLPHIA